MHQMPKKARNSDELQEVKRQILDTALELINQDGYSNFSMRKLAARLGVTATTIYQYYSNKDELYLGVITRGFEELFTRMDAAYQLENTPQERMRQVFLAYIEFGIDRANFYNLMTVFDVPKYYDYVGTATETVAQTELETALKVRELGKRVIEESDIVANVSPEEQETMILRIFCSIHGFISFYNSQIMDYLINSPKRADRDEAIARFIDAIILPFK
jgi:AcrR family transcriptional regulator